MTLRILQFGTTGQLATELTRQASAHDVELTALSRTDCDLGDPQAAARAVAEARPDLVVIAAAYTAVDLAETERDLARTVNALAPGAIAKACAATGAALVNISTDYVFAGDGGAPYAEDAATNPLNVYGATKLEGERAVAAGCPPRAQYPHILGGLRPRQEFRQDHAAGRHGGKSAPGGGRPTGPTDLGR